MLFLRQSEAGKSRAARAVLLFFRAVLPLALLPAGVFFAGAARGQQKAEAKETGSSHTATTPAAKKAPSKTSVKKSKKGRASTRSRAQKAPTADRILEIQSALARSSHFSGEPTGKWDAASINAMKGFQQAQGLKATGKIDAASLQKLGLGSHTAGVAAPRPSASAAEGTTRNR